MPNPDPDLGHDHHLNPNVNLSLKTKSTVVSLLLLSFLHLSVLNFGPWRSLLTSVIPDLPAGPCQDVTDGDHSDRKPGHSEAV